jgi:TIR domain
MYAFLSYHNSDRSVAASIKTLLATLDIDSFMAHEDIGVSEEWRKALLSALRNVNIFVCILSKQYWQSVWCTQEAGIAASRNGLAIIPLSIDGTLPQGFIGHVQSTKIDPTAPDRNALLQGLAKRHASFLIDKLIIVIGKSGNYRKAETNFELILPYLKKAKPAQVAELLKVSTTNNQVCNAGLCVNTYLPPLLKSHGHLMDKAQRKELEETLARYATH